MKSKFAGLNFDSVEVLTQEEKKKVKGGYGNGSSTAHWMCPTGGATYEYQYLCNMHCVTYKLDEKGFWQSTPQSCIYV